MNTDYQIITLEKPPGRAISEYFILASSVESIEKACQRRAGRMPEIVYKYSTGFGVVYCTPVVKEELK